MIYAETLTERVEAELLHRITVGEYRYERYLPPEIGIAEDLGISRNILRDVLAVLEQEGFISRRRGVGTLLNRHVLSIKTRMDLYDEFWDIVTSAGYTPGRKFFPIREEKCSQDLANKLQLSVDSNVICFPQVVTANNQSAIFCNDYIPANLLEDSDVSNSDLDNEKTVFDLLEKRESERTFMTISDVYAVLSDEIPFELEDVDSGVPVILLESIHYTFKGKPLFSSKEYYLNGLIKQSLVRKKISKHRNDWEKNV